MNTKLKINLIEKYSTDAMKQLNKKYDISFIDGSHDGKIVIEDIKNSDRILRINGLIIIDDVLHKGVKDAILEFFVKNNNYYRISIDKKTNKGLVYKDSLNGNSYVPMEFENIASESIKKLKKQLLNIHDSIHEELYEDIKNDIINGDFLDEFKKNIHQKYDNFINEKETKEKVEKMIYHIYESNQERALNVLESKVSKEKIEGY